jgi:hypothetical protein
VTILLKLIWPYVIRPYEINQMHIFKGSVNLKIVSWLYLNLQMQSLTFYT